MFISLPELQAMMLQLGDLGVCIAMFLESSIVPIPSELVVIGAGAIGIPISSIVIFGSIGSALGSIVGYCLGRYAAMPVIEYVGKWLFIKPHHIKKAEAFAQKYGAAGVLIGRLLPIIPFKVFSIAAGMTRLRFLPFLLFTCIGVAPRLWLLGMFGHAAVEYTKYVVIIGGAALIGFIVVKYIIRRRKQEGLT